MSLKDAKDIVEQIRDGARDYVGYSASIAGPLDDELQVWLRRKGYETSVENGIVHATDPNGKTWEFTYPKEVNK
jgi:hypothetical protein